ncbi:pentapeptide repeat-containing protein [Rodentibacter genomosp. 2]|uniref:pentapeptide repeat-containing protein n=1 Tax=Rodentibacter genomosp. 2 TaxID=1908266 RepID=UPI000985A9D9
MKFMRTKLAIVFLGFSAVAFQTQADNNQSVSVKGTIINSASDGGESVQNIAGKKSKVVNGTIITHNGKTVVSSEHVADIENVHMNATLKGKDYSGQSLVGAVFTNSDLSHANFSNANLQGADFTNTQLKGANFNHANLKGANLTNANLEDADLSHANLKGATRVNINTQGAKTKGTIWK